MHFITRLWAILLGKPLLTLGGVGIVIAVSASFFLRGEAEEKLLTVTRGDFVRDVSVSGKVTSAQNVELGFDQGGRVSGVYAAVGSRVAAGVVLASIENGDIRADVLEKEAALETARAQLRALEAGTRPEEIAVKESEVSAAQTVLAQAREEVVNAIKEAYTTSDDAVRYRADKILSSPRTASPQVNFVGADSALETKVEAGRPPIEELLLKWEKDMVSLSASSPNLSSEATVALSRLASVRTFLDSAAQLMNSLTSSATLSQSTLDGYRTDIATGRTNVNASVSSLTGAITAEKNAVTSLMTKERNLILVRAGTTPEDLAAEAARVKSAEANLLNAEARLKKTLVVAPFSGIVTKMDAKVGALASANTSLISMIGLGTFQIESYVPEINVAQIKVGDEAVVTLDTYGSEVPFGAVVVSIDPAETIRDGVSTYRAVLQFKAPDERVKSGMTANVIVTTEKKVGVISIPQGLIVNRDGKKFVLVKEGEATVEREVTVGSVSSIGDLEITSGLSEGDRIVLDGEEK